MVINITLFVLGFVLLIKSADILVEGSSSIAKKFGVSTFFIGLTIVAFGTSAPEMIISLMASIKGSAGLALGNVIGSSISNTLLILGVSAIITPLLVKRTTISKEIPFSLLAILAVFFLANDKLIDGSLANGLSRIDGFILILFFIIFVYYTFGILHEKESLIEKAVEDIIEEKPKDHSNIISGLMILAGLTGLVIGGQWIVNGAVLIAALLGASEILIGLTIVAVGTSLPELATSAVAAYKGKTDIAVGNVIGSNIFNLFLVLGISSGVRTISFDAVLNIDIIILAATTILLLFLIYYGKKNVLARREGAIMIFLYVLYLIYLVYRG